MNTPTTKNITKLGLHSTFESVNVALSISCNGCNFQRKLLVSTSFIQIKFSYLKYLYRIYRVSTKYFP